MPVSREHTTKDSLIEDIQNSTHAADHLEAVTNGVLYLLGYREDSKKENDSLTPQTVFTEPGGRGDSPNRPASEVEKDTNVTNVQKGDVSFFDRHPTGIEEKDILVKEETPKKKG